MTIQELEIEINKLKERNKMVETNKAWETSWSRKFLIATLTYLVIAFLFVYGGFSEPFKNAVVPTLGFILSTTSISFFKDIWIKYLYKKS